MNIAYTSSDAYSQYVGISMMSLFDHNKTVQDITVYIIDMQISDNNKKRLQSIADKYKRTALFIDGETKITEFVKKFKLDGFHGGINSYSKIFPDVFLPENIDKVLFLDADTIIHDSLSELYDNDISSYVLAAVPDVGVYFFGHEDFKIANKNSVYFNTGVILYNMEKVRSSHLKERIIQARAEYKGALKLADQSLINLALNDGEGRRVHFKFNNYVHTVPANIFRDDYTCDKNDPWFQDVTNEIVEARKKPAVIHYVRGMRLGGRPWYKWNTSYYYREYIKYWKRSPWKDVKRASNVAEMKRIRHIQYKETKIDTPILGSAIILFEIWFSKYASRKQWEKYQRSKSRGFLKKVSNAVVKIGRAIKAPFKAIKKLFRRICPVSKAQFNNEINNTTKLLTNQNQKILSQYTSLAKTVADGLSNIIKADSGFEKSLELTNEKLEKLENQFVNLFNQVQNKLNALNECINKIDMSNGEMQNRFDGFENALRTLQLIKEKFWLTDCKFDREYYAEFPTSTTDTWSSFEEDFQTLIHGLDDVSIQTIVDSLNRLRKIQTGLGSTMNLLSQIERDAKDTIQDSFVSKIIKLSDECYYCNGALLPIDHFEACVFHYKCGLTYVDHPERFMDRDIIDAGAFIGDSAIVFSPFTERKVYAFEPAPQNYELLLKTIEMNHLSNVVPCQYALGAEKSVATLALSGSSSTMFENNTFKYSGHVQVNTITLDDYVRENNLKVGLIKTDLEGAEQLFLRGAVNTITTQRPTLLISIYHNADDYFHIKPMLERLNLGYRFKVRHLYGSRGVGSSVMTETMLIAELE